MKDKRILQLTMVVLGSIIAAFGVDLAIHAGFGSGTLAVLWQGVSIRTGLTIGQSSLLVAAVMVAFCWFYDRKQISWGTVIFQVVYGIFTDIFAGIIRFPQARIAAFAVMLLGIAVNTLGTALYSAANFGRGSYEALTFALVERNGWQTRVVRSILDLSWVVLGMLLGGQPGICTLCMLTMNGVFIQFWMKHIRDWMGRHEGGKGIARTD